MMIPVSHFIRGGLIAAGLAALATGPAGAATPSKAPDRPESCFFVTDWQGWKSPSPDVIYLGVGLHDVYRVQLSSGSSALQWPDARLVSEVRGPDTICSAIDLDLSVSDGHGFREPLIATSLVKLDPAEVAAIPKALRP